MSIKANTLIDMIPASAIYEMKQSGINQFEEIWARFRTQIVRREPLDITVEDRDDRLEYLRYTQNQLIQMLRILTSLASR